MTASRSDALVLIGGTGDLAHKMTFPVLCAMAEQGLATGVRGSVDRAALAKVMKFSPNQKILLAQSVGYARK